MASRSFVQFESLLRSVDQLTEIHGKLQQGAGRRYEQEAIHRAGVVLTVAAWQAYVEKLLQEATNAIEARLNMPEVGIHPPGWAVVGFQVRKAVILTSITKFNTPNDQNIQRLFKESIGFDPCPAWVWRVRRRQWEVKEVRARTNAWVLIRHSVAHGFGLPTDITWIRGPNGIPRLNLSLLKECRKHFHYVAGKTDRALSAYLSASYAMLPPW